MFINSVLNDLFFIKDRKKEEEARSRNAMTIAELQKINKEKQKDAGVEVEKLDKDEL